MIARRWKEDRGALLVEIRHEPRRRLRFVWSCSNYRNHKHRWRWTASACGWWQQHVLMLHVPAERRNSAGRFCLGLAIVAAVVALWWTACVRAVLLRAELDNGARPLTQQVER